MVVGDPERVDEIPGFSPYHRPDGVEEAEAGAGRYSSHAEADPRCQYSGRGGLWAAAQHRDARDRCGSQFQDYADGRRSSDRSGSLRGSLGLLFPHLGTHAIAGSSQGLQPDQVRPQNQWRGPESRVQRNPSSIKPGRQARYRIRLGGSGSSQPGRHARKLRVDGGKLPGENRRLQGTGRRRETRDSISETTWPSFAFKRLWMPGSFSKSK